MTQEDWQLRPTSINSLSAPINYALFIDESGDTSTKHVDYCIRKNINPPSNDLRYLGLAGVIFHLPAHEVALQRIMQIKLKHWPPDGMHEKARKKCSDRSRVCLHTVDITRNRGPFHDSIIDRNIFFEDIDGVMQDLEMTLMACVIDKYNYSIKYGQKAWAPYQMAAECLMERFSYHLNAMQGFGVIILESRGEKEDYAVLSHMNTILEKGNYYNSSSIFNRIKGVYFNPKWCLNGQQSYIGLEIVDLCCQPLVRATIYGKSLADRSYEIIKSKVRGYPNNVTGRGLKLLP